MEMLTMQSAVELLGIEADTSRRTANIPCPVCGKGKEKKLNINFEKNVFRCNKCELAGGPLNFWAVYRGLAQPTSREDAKMVAKDYFAFTCESPKAGAVIRKKIVYEKIDQRIADIDVRDRTYRALLKLLSLSDSHKENLLNRGLDLERIEKNEYRSYPRAGLTDLSSLLLESGYILDGVPGFYKPKNGKWSLRRLPSGFLIPQRDGFSRIQGFQLRVDKPAVDTPKYLTLSTAEMNMGAKGGTYPHLAMGEKGIDEIILTEGPLKGDIVSHLTGYSVFCVTGVNALERIAKPLADLKDAGMKNLLIAYDMDLKRNENVKKALQSLKKILDKIGVPYGTLDWDDNYKGLDDYLSAKQFKRG